MPPRNRLAGETSPYLLQHADNPVAWWPWSDEAFAEARRRDVPVLISVGYSACHWCHVMAHESFEDDEVAAVLNSGFVPVKVDREERPDVDAVYMEAVQALTGSGGWPMTVLATPQGRPFWGGTYLPKARFLQLLREVSRLWLAQRDDLEKDAARLAGAIKEAAEPPSAGAGSTPADGASGDLLRTSRGDGRAGSSTAQPAEEVLARAAHGILASRDPEWGGSAGRPKFPQPAALEVLARHWWRSGSTSAGQALCRSLDAMSSGGIYDHLGGGFARYSTDRYWLVPHFEKMLYDNALLLRAYTYAWQLTGAPRYRQVVLETASYLLSPPLRLPEGAWAAAEDADSEGEEGRFYTWSWQELLEVAGREAAVWYGASPAGNWEGKNILWRPRLGGLERPAEIEQARLRLLERRATRPRPGLDTKVLTEWNAMAIAALAYAGTAFGQPAWAQAAEATAELLLSVLRREDGRWLRSWRPVPAGVPTGGAAAKHLAYAGDYAWLVEAFTRLAEATGRRIWAESARETAAQLTELFGDQERGGFFTYGRDGEELIARMKDLFDGAVPSANAVAAGALARLGELTGEAEFTVAATRALERVGPSLLRAPSAFPASALAVDYLARPRRQVVVASSDRALVRPVWERYLPDTVLAWGEPYESALWRGRDGPSSEGLAFLCEGFACNLPVRGAEALAALLRQGPVGEVAAPTTSA